MENEVRSPWPEKTQMNRSRHKTLDLLERITSAAEVVVMVFGFVVAGYVVAIALIKIFS